MNIIYFTVLLIYCVQLTQLMICILLDIRYGDYVLIESKKEFFIRLIPLYFVFVLIKKIFTHISDLP